VQHIERQRLEKFASYKTFATSVDFAGGFLVNDSRPPDDPELLVVASMSVSWCYAKLSRPTLHILPPLFRNI
jgi:hypothetical protein